MNSLKSLLCIVLVLLLFTSKAQEIVIKDFNPKKLKIIGKVDVRYQSYNIEMAQIVGGQFWKPYKDMDSLPNSTGGISYNVSQKNTEMYSMLPAVNLYDKRLVILAKGLEPAYVRVSGTWANAIYFQDNNNKKLDKAPDGFAYVLTRSEWKGVVDFAKATNSKIVTSFAVSNGVRDKQGIWTPIQAQKIVDYTQKIGGQIAAAEMFNEPNLPTSGGEIANNYNASDFAKDEAVFRKWAKTKVPYMKTLGPGTATLGLFTQPIHFPGMDLLFPDSLLAAKPNPKFDIFTYHYYGAISMRMMQNGPLSIKAENALSSSWLTKTDSIANYYINLRNSYSLNKQIWITETAEAAAGGDPFSATYTDCFRYLCQLGSLATKGITSIMHNTLCASEYSFVDQDTYLPKPDYWAAFLWAKFMGTTVYDAGKRTDGIYLFAHSLKGYKNGIALLIINTNSQAAQFHLSHGATVYTLTAKNLNSGDVQLNGIDLKLNSNGTLPEIKGKHDQPGYVSIPATSISFIVFK